MLSEIGSCDSIQRKWLDDGLICMVIHVSFFVGIIILKSSGADVELGCS